MIPDLEIARVWPFHANVRLGFDHVLRGSCTPEISSLLDNANH
jgi:hypothetical protein